MTKPQLALLAAMTCRFFSSCFSVDPIVENWELEWNVFVFNENDQKTIENNLGNLLRNHPRREALKKTPPKSLSYLKPIDWTDPRMAPVCRLTVFRSGMVAGSCSCAFIKPDMVVTAAHCLTKPGVTPRSGHMLYVQEKFGSDLPDKKAKDATHDDYKPNIVTEWWFPTAFTAARSKKNVDLFDSIRYDIAFLRTRLKGSSEYQLMPPFQKGGHNVGGENMAILGYPDAYLSSEVGVMTTGRLLPNAEMKEIENDAAAANEVASASMTEGGSGGPIIQSKAGLDRYTGQFPSLRPVLSMAAFAVTGLAGKPGTEHAYRNYAIEISKKLVNAMEHIYKVGKQGEGSKYLRTADDGNLVIRLTSIKD